MNWLDIDKNDNVNKIEFVHGLDRLQSLLLLEEHDKDAKPEDKKGDDEDDDRFKDMNEDDWVVELDDYIKA